MRSSYAVILLAAAALATLPIAAARDPAVVRAFRATHPCPATHQTTGACPGWVVDHLDPLCAGGADAVANMAWQPYGESLRKDSLERQLCAMIRAERARSLRVD